MNKMIVATGRFLDANQVISIVKQKTSLHRSPRRADRHVYETFDGVDKVRITTSRTILFANKGIACVICGATANKVLVEKDRNSKSDHWSLGFYIDRGDNNMKILTIDHIVPVSRGGSYLSDQNLQPMCCDCNSKKGNITDYYNQK
jgi:hypothetical protein